MNNAIPIKSPQLLQKIGKKSKIHIEPQTNIQTDKLGSQSNLEEKEGSAERLPTQELKLYSRNVVTKTTLNWHKTDMWINGTKQYVLKVYPHYSLNFIGICYIISFFISNF